MSRTALTLAIVTALAVQLGAGTAAAQGRVIILNVNEPGVGFNDPTPAPPVAGNPGTTFGEQRLAVFERAAEIWTATVQPVTDIVIQARFIPLAPNVLGSAGATFIFNNFPGAEFADTWYHSALADQLAGVELNPGFPDIAVNFSTNFPFYLGFDNNEPAGQFDLLAVALHEIGHGMGFSNFTNELTGAFIQGLPDIYSQYTFDVTTRKLWTEITDAERAASAVRVRRVAWNGLEVNRNVPDTLAPGDPGVQVLEPASLGRLPFGLAAFGPQLTSTGVTGIVELGVDASDAAGPSITDGCSALTNDLTGKIALIDRGTCGFTIKVKNAQNAGAIAVVIADNVQASPPAGLGGADDTITIPSGRIALSDANNVRAALAAGAVTVRLDLDLSILAGTDAVEGLMLVAALNPVALGSSISHYDSGAFPNQLMEPSINVDLTSSLDAPVDLTSSLMADVGWFSDQDGVPDGRDVCLRSDLRDTVVFGSFDSRADNDFFANGCTISDVVGQSCPLDLRLGSYIVCVGNVTHGLLRDRVITLREKVRIVVSATLNRLVSGHP